MASNSSCSSKEEEEEEEESIQLKGLICIIFSWTLKDVLNEHFYRDKVQRIPETFSSEEHYLESLRCPLLAETHTELFSSINNIHQSPTCKITSVHKHKDFKMPDFLVYDIMFDASKDTGYKNEIYKPHPSDVITFTHVRPVRFGSLERSYVPAFVLQVSRSPALEKEKGNNRTYLVQILASKPINEKTCMPTYAVFLINVTTNRRIWDALHGGNLNIVKKVLHEYQGGVKCGSCSQEVKRVPGKRLSKDLGTFNLNESQLHAVRSSIRTSACNHRNSVQLIWGPPGTGKTKTASALLWAMLKMKCRTLTCSPTNIGVVEVSARLMSIVRPTLQRGFSGLGDIVLFGNKDRMKIGDRCDLLDIFLDDRVEKVAKCLSYRTGWGSQLEAMILLLRNSSQQYSLYKDWRESNVEKKDSSAPVNIWEGLEDERSGLKFRMHPSISLFPNSEFYGKRLADAPNVKQKGYKRSLLDGDMYGPYSFINVPYGKEEFNDGHSRKNMLEAAVIDVIVQNLYKASVTNSQKVSVGVISPYKAQVSALIKKFGYKYEQQSNFSVSVRSVDGFQGGEEDIILISTVRTFGCGSVGFLSNRQRTNVAITRERYCLWIVGDGQALINSYSVWRKLLLNAKARGCYYNATEDYRLSKAIVNALAELNQLDDLINMNSLLLKGAWWKVIYGDGFLKYLRRVKNVETKKDGWRCHPEKPMKPENMTSYSSQLLEQSRITGNLYLLWTVDTIKENSRYIQVLKFLDILPLTEIPKFVEQLDSQFKTSTVDEMNRRKFKRLEGYVLINLYHLLLHLSHNYLTICCSNRSM
ncbi:hypothetical protein MKW98_006921 [Papaver atlanticum]|uniref:Helicase MAGATAMA 3 n=1 Tax=Papaver atlanticum TaxID=357466 RepID=A0AAD4ST19_9MAGN|nr:hypothetical protein MKW98_006921 [Papaver atlanticum]